MRKGLTALIAGIGVAILAIAAVAALQIGASDATAQGGPGLGSGNAGTTRTGMVHVAPDTTTTLTADEASGLQYMREEEKLAHDVYAVLGAKYESRVFANISRSESQHTATVKTYLDAFKIDDPAAGEAAGRFRDDGLQALYAQLVAQGDTSLTAAINVGIAVEKRDIADLRAKIAATGRADLKAMYGNLLRASQNHLGAFQRQLSGGAAAGQIGGQGHGQGASQGLGGGQGRGQGGQGSCY